MRGKTDSKTYWGRGIKNEPQCRRIRRSPVPFSTQRHTQVPLVRTGSLAERSIVVKPFLRGMHPYRYQRRWDFGFSGFIQIYRRIDAQAAIALACDSKRRSLLFGDPARPFSFRLAYSMGVSLPSFPDGRVL
jgi:hypothetical protein